jgi:hypothetical protein
MLQKSRLQCDERKGAGVPVLPHFVMEGGNSSGASGSWTGSSRIARNAKITRIRNGRH